MADTDLYRTILPAGSVITATGSTGPLSPSDDVDPSGFDVIANITAVSGTAPTVVFTVQWATSPDTSTYPPTSWSAGVSSAALSTAARTVVSTACPVRAATGTAPAYYRVSWVVTGTTPSFTLALYGE